MLRPFSCDGRMVRGRLKSGRRLCSTVTPCSSPLSAAHQFAVVGRHEGSGSLFAHLKAAGWAAALWAGESHLSFSTRSFFSVNVELTDEGTSCQIGLAGFLRVILALSLASVAFWSCHGWSSLLQLSVYPAAGFANEDSMRLLQPARTTASAQTTLRPSHR